MRPSPLQNRVTPEGEIIAHPFRGAFMGNRGGRLHDPLTKKLGVRRWASKQWIYCTLSFKGRQRDIMGDSYTELFFFDEASALAAGHRPCFECQRKRAIEFQACLTSALDLRQPIKAADIDRLLHRERNSQTAENSVIDPGMSLPDGVFVRQKSKIGTLKNNAFFAWSPEGYHKPETIDRRNTQSITPRSVVATFNAGFSPSIAI